MSTGFRRLVPALNRLLVKKRDPITKTKTGIILQETEKQNIGTIIEIGPGDLNKNGERIPMQFKVGATVLLPEFGGTQVNLKDGEFFLYRDTDLLGELER